MIGLTGLLERNCIMRRNVMTKIGGVVTGIYYVTPNGVHLGPTSTGAVIIAAGWQYKVNNAGHIQLSDTDPTEWIVDIEDQKLKEETDNRKLIVSLYYVVESRKLRAPVSPLTMIERVVIWRSTYPYP
jgi:hypothetical protein